MATLHKIELPDYGDEELNNLGNAVLALNRMTTEQRLRALQYFKSRYSKEWPNDSNY